MFEILPPQSSLYPNLMTNLYIFKRNQDLMKDVEGADLMK